MSNVGEFIIQLLLTNGVIIAAASFVIGEIVKKLEIKDKYIPLIGGTVGILLGIFIPNIFPNHDIITSGIMGLCLGWTATGGFETVKQLKKKG